jgi:hypothetical protein
MARSLREGADLRGSLSSSSRRRSSASSSASGNRSRKAAASSRASTLRVKPRSLNLRCSFLRVAADGAAIGERAGRREWKSLAGKVGGVWGKWRDNNGGNSWASRCCGYLLGRVVDTIWIWLYLAISAGLSGPAQSTTKMAQPEHGLAQSLLGRAGLRCPDF